MERRIDRIRLCREFVLEQFRSSTMEENHWRYRYEHTLRVAAVGQQIAVREGLDVQALELGCLLHDVGYIRCRTEEDFAHHGRLSAEIAELYLYRLGLEIEQVESICYGIAAHTEEEHDLPRPCTALENSIGDADNIDRFDALRMADTLTYFDLMNQRPKDIVTICDRQIARYSEYYDLPFATPTATELWRERLGFQLSYFRRLKRQMELSV